ncbi:type I 3-dehydroquinate dehydratase [Lentilactobacillus sp. Marseille-Q4993]|uniref:type I 3-dehydroquinate dehydratase n=1 Tax=Lentilactobacillus sp. Marseille-Q4993 TaxID=3039492 RepID=UPI0024BD0574|nr:type I 3-dehydroquinate dehydratase [Lentilactobacillus sp. Marseille-Q4993]
MNIVKIGATTLGTDQPKIAVPIIGTTETEIISAAKKIVLAKPDLVEWRIDYFSQVTDNAMLSEIGNKLKDILEGLPLLVTFRTKSEGGNLSLAENQYIQLCKQVCEGDYADAVDVELNHDSEQIERLVDYIHQNKKVVIMSNHDFKSTPDETEIIIRLTAMQNIGADVLKIAVMPNSAADVLTLMTATSKASTSLQQPIVSMAMGDLGKVTRISGQLIGSSMTFATVGEVSAPGQMGVENVRLAMQLLQNFN